jgi:hypothetical protein
MKMIEIFQFTVSTVIGSVLIGCSDVVVGVGSRVTGSVLIGKVDSCVVVGVG